MKKGRLPDTDWAVHGEKAFRNAVSKAIARHHQAGNPVHFERNGKIVKVAAPSEQRSQRSALKKSGVAPRHKSVGSRKG